MQLLVQAGTEAVNVGDCADVQGGLIQLRHVDPGSGLV